MTAARNGSPVCGMLVQTGFKTQQPRQRPDKLETCRHGGRVALGRLDSPLACYRSA